LRNDCLIVLSPHFGSAIMIICILWHYVKLPW